MYNYVRLRWKWCTIAIFIRVFVMLIPSVGHSPGPQSSFRLMLIEYLRAYATVTDGTDHSTVVLRNSTSTIIAVVGFDLQNKPLR